MNDNFYVEDMLLSIRKDTTLERYWRLMPVRGELLDRLKGMNVVFRDDVTDDVLSALTDSFGEDTVALFARFLHLYDFNKAKLKEISHVSDADEYSALADLLRLPGVRILRAQLYYNSGVTLEALAEKPAEEIQSMVREYVERENCPQTVPFRKEVSCHKEVAKMILHLKEQNTPSD